MSESTPPTEEELGIWQRRAGYLLQSRSKQVPTFHPKTVDRLITEVRRQAQEVKALREALKGVMGEWHREECYAPLAHPWIECPLRLRDVPEYHAGVAALEPPHE